LILLKIIEAFLSAIELINPSNYTQKLLNKFL